MRNSFELLEWLWSQQRNLQKVRNWNKREKIKNIKEAKNKSNDLQFCRLLTTNEELFCFDYKKILKSFHFLKSLAVVIFSYLLLKLNYFINIFFCTNAYSILHFQLIYFILQSNQITIVCLFVSFFAINDQHLNFPQRLKH